MFPFADTNPTRRWELVNILIIAMNFIAFVWLSSLPEQRQEQVVIHRGFIPARIQQLSDPQKVVLVPKLAQVQFVHQIMPAQPVEQLRADRTEILTSTVTCMFLHGGWLHLLGNMWFLFIFGNNVEDRIGHFLYAVFYLVGGLVATFTHWFIDPSSTAPVIGASGAVAAVLGAYAITFPHARIKTLVFLVIIVTVVEVPAYFFLAVWFGIQLLEGIGALQIPMDPGAGGGVAWWAHVGGFAAGAILMPILSAIAPSYPDAPDEFKPPRDPTIPGFAPGYDDHQRW